MLARRAVHDSITLNSVVGIGWLGGSVVMGVLLRLIARELSNQGILHVEGNVRGSHLAQPDVVQGLSLPDQGDENVNYEGANPANISS